MHTAIHTEHAPAAIGPYSQAIDCGAFVMTSGQIPVNPENGAMAEATIEAQGRQVLENVKAVLEAAGLTMADVVKSTVFMVDLKDFGAFNALYASYFPGTPPARSCVQVAALPKGSLVEMEVIAVR